MQHYAYFLFLVCSLDKDVFIQFHYCDTIPETRECVDDEVAIELDTIAGIFPQKLRKLNCQCSGNGRMVLKRSRQRRFGYLVHQYYSCMLVSFGKWNHISAFFFFSKYVAQWKAWLSG